MNATVRILFRKELTELLRDRRVLLMSILLPVLIYPAVMGGMERLERRQAEQREREVLDVAVTAADPTFTVALRADSTLHLRSAADPESLRVWVERGEIEAWLDARAGMAATADSVLPTLRLVAHEARSLSQEARGRIESALEEVRGQERQRRYEAAGGIGRLRESLAFSDGDLSTRAEAGGAQAGRLLVYLLVMTLFMGGSAFSTDIVAGEKERGTLETLFLLPAERGAIARAKLLVVSLGTSLTGLLSLLSLMVSYRMGWIGEAQVELGTRALLLSLLLVIPLAVLIGSVLLAISAHARSLKEAQQYILPVMLVLFVPALMSTSQAVEMNLVLALVPVANVAFLMRDVLVGQVALGYLLLSAAASLGWALLAMRVVTRLLSKEETVLGFDPEPFLAKTPGGRSRAFHVSMAVSLLAYFYLGNLIQARWGIGGLALSLWLLMPLLGMGVARLAWSGGSLRDLLSLRPARAEALLGAVFLALGALLPVLGGLLRLQAWLLPAPEEFSAADTILEGVPTWQLLVVGALSPAIVEELVFRGLCLGLARRRMGIGSAVVVSSIYFALMHLSVFRLLPTFVLGVVMGTLTVRTRSILPAMLFHLFYNGSVMLGAVWFQDREPPFDLQGALAWGLSLGLLLLGLVLVRRGRGAGGATS